MLTAEQLQVLAAHFGGPQVQAVLLVGSYARGSAEPYSDVDLLRLTSSSLPDAGSHLWQDMLVNVSDADADAVEAWFTEPDQAVEVVLGLRDAQVLLDLEGAAAEIVQRAETFVWTDELQKKANRWASAQLVGWAEEARKGLAGVRTGDNGRLLHAQFGLSWGLAKMIRVQRGLLSKSDNAFLADLQGAFAGTRWLELLHAVYGLTGLALTEQVRAGLALYAHTADLLAPVLQDGDRPVVEHTVHLIRRAE
jgi:predicted nucleotidyltransferase